MSNVSHAELFEFVFSTSLLRPDDRPCFSSVTVEVCARPNLTAGKGSLTVESVVRRTIGNRAVCHNGMVTQIGHWAKKKRMMCERNCEAVLQSPKGIYFAHSFPRAFCLKFVRAR